MNQSNQMASPNRPMPRRIISSDGELLSLLGAAVRLKLTSRETLGAYCVCEGRLPPGSFVPLHYHAEVETFIVLNGTLELLQMKGADAEAFSVEAGEIAFIPSNAVHGFRNMSGVDVQLLIIGGPRIESFLVEAGTLEPQSKGRDSGEPDSSEFLRMLEVAKRHGQTFLEES
jgi:mannose-6-phosphate isomerase-like protein (cupin superfamily)